MFRTFFFFTFGVMPKGCNDSFITLITKTHNPILMKDLRSISLIRLQYKIIIKILASRMAKVVGSLVSEVQIAFMKGRQILDGFNAE